MSAVVVPNPGSDEAVAEGCTCPVIDNGYGRGVGVNHPVSGLPIFVFDWACPLHGSGDWREASP